MFETNTLLKNTLLPLWKREIYPLLMKKESKPLMPSKLALLTKMLGSLIQRLSLTSINTCTPRDEGSGTSSTTPNIKSGSPKKRSRRKTKLLPFTKKKT